MSSYKFLTCDEFWCATSGPQRLLGVFLACDEWSAQRLLGAFLACDEWSAQRLLGVFLVCDEWSAAAARRFFQLQRGI